MRFVASKMRASKVRNRYFVEIPSRAKFSEQPVPSLESEAVRPRLSVGMGERKSRNAYL